MSLPRVCLLTTGIALFQLAKGFNQRATSFWLAVKAEMDHQRSGLPR